MQSLAGLAAILAKFTVSPAPETQRELISDSRSTIVQNVIGGIPLNFTARLGATVAIAADTESSRSL